MISSLYRFAKWLVQKFALGVFIAVLGLAAYGLWLFLRDNVDFDAVRRQFLAQLNGDRRHFRAVLDDADKRMAEIQADLAKQQARAQTTGKAIAGLEGLQSTWARFFGDSEQQRAYAEQLAHMQQLKHDAEKRAVDLQEQLVRTQWEKDGIEIALGKLDRRIRTEEANQSRVVHYLLLAWDKAKWYVAAVLGLYFFGPALGKIFMFFGLARLIESGRPVRLAEDPAALPQVSESRPSLDVSLWPGEQLWVKESFLQASDEGLRRRTRFVLDWRLPFTCLACGLVELIEMRNTRAGEEFRVTFSHHDDATVELALVALPDGGSIVLRPSFLKAVIVAGDNRLKIRRHWRFFTWQSWVTLQFRYFEFAGPCQLLVAGSRGVRAERLKEREGQERPARRANQDVTIGFTPNLEYRPVRAETFWAYFRNMNPLFDDLFAGVGLFLCQRTAARGPASGARRFWAGLWGGVLKVFGL
ncbi:MAG TPA: hypothetical protein VMI53_00675 [Opitutaceae bacterium]|nr:hypothetical protein [Opitutaceae bacterium]